MVKPNLHILGIQGSGKGTQSTLLAQAYNLSHLSSGEWLRTRAKVNDKLGTTLNQEITAGKLISDPMLFELVQDFVRKDGISVGFIGDGVIRTESQVTLYQPIWDEAGLDKPYLIVLDLDETTALQRLLHRGQGDLARSDDTEESIRRRFELFHSTTKPVIDSFEQSGRCFRVNAGQDIQSIHKQIVEKVADLFPNLSYVAD